MNDGEVIKRMALGHKSHLSNLDIANRLSHPLSFWSHISVRIDSDRNTLVRLTWETLFFDLESGLSKNSSDRIWFLRNCKPEPEPAFLFPAAQYHH